MAESELSRMKIIDKDCIKSEEETKDEKEN